MRKFYIIVLVLALLLSGKVHSAYADNGSCVDLSKAKALAAWAVSSGATYSNDNRTCSSGSALSGAPSGSPSSTGYCTTYDCSSFATWILRQIPGQAAVPAAPAGPPDTYVMWGSETTGAQNGAPSGMKPCDPTKQPVCLGLTEFGEGGMSGPGHVVTALCGKVYSASPPIMDNYATPVSGTMQSSSEGEIVWITPFGLEHATMNSCSSSCSPSSAGGYGGAGEGGAGLGDAGAAGEQNNLMMDMMMGSMEPMMSAMGALSALGSGASTGSTGSGSTATGSNAANTAAADAAATTGSGTAASAAATGASGSGTTGSGTTASSSTATGGFSSLVGRLSSVLAGGSSGTAAPTSGAAAAAATAPSSGLAASTAAQDLQNLDQEAADETPLNSSLAADPAAANPTQDYHDLGLSDHRLSCSLTAGATVDSCRSATSP
jgi:hypothetical protein